jgi:hypothetical protein
MGDGDPEFAATLTSGTWIKEKEFMSKPHLKQAISRCKGGGWVLFNNKEPFDFATVRTGRGFIDLIDKNDESCNLIFTWNEDASNAIITTYFLSNELIKKPLEYVFKLEIGLTSYWKWKFGLKTSMKEKANALLMDSKCCPPPSEDVSCLGEGVLGKAGTPCETISMACGEIAAENVNQCPFIHRKNGAVGLKLGFYNVYALSDKYGNPTTYMKHYVNVFKEKGVEDLFHPLERKNDKSSKSTKEL